MTRLTRWEPLSGMRRLHNMLDRIMDESLLESPFPEEWAEGLSPVDLYETEEEVIVKASLPGVSPEDIDISISDDVLRIRAEVSEAREEGKEGEEVLLRERRFRSFYRSLRLPAAVDSDQAEAEIENGVLTLTMPKVEEAKPKTISVKAK